MTHSVLKPIWIYACRLCILFSVSGNSYAAQNSGPLEMGVFQLNADRYSNYQGAADSCLVNCLIVLKIDSHLLFIQRNDKGEETAYSPTGVTGSGMGERG